MVACSKKSVSVRFKNLQMARLMQSLQLMWQHEASTFVAFHVLFTMTLQRMERRSSIVVAEQLVLEILAQ